MGTRECANRGSVELSCVKNKHQSTIESYKSIRAHQSRVENKVSSLLDRRSE